mgnify:CR=1 FL=1
MTNAEIREFKSYVRDTLVRKYHLNDCLLYTSDAADD